VAWLNLEPAFDRTDVAGGLDCCFRPVECAPLNARPSRITAPGKEDIVKNQVRRKRITVAKNFGRVHVFGIIAAIAVLVVGAVTVLSRQSVRKEPKKQETASVIPDQPKKSYVTVEVGGKKLQLDAQTLQQGPLTQDQAQQISDALKDNKSTDGLVQVQHPDGSVSVDLQGRFQNVVLAKRSDDGSISQACVDNSEAANAFLQSQNSTKQSQPEPGAKAKVKE
jgi:Na+-translocating ferredoxin:NAD+ oxidoreductase RnfG subunit